MKLRNKKTGEVVDAYSIDTNGVEIIRVQYFTKNGKLDHFDFNTLEELNDCLEDYEPKEPLIKDEKIRKAVRAWAEANEIGPQEIIRFNAIEHRLSWISTAIEFNEFEALSDLEKEDYTIAELCGEEEE